MDKRIRDHFICFNIMVLLSIGTVLYLTHSVKQAHADYKHAVWKERTEALLLSTKE